MARWIMDKEAGVQGEVRFERMAEARGGISKRRVEPDVEPGIAVSTGPDDDVPVHQYFRRIRGWTHEESPV